MASEKSIFHESFLWQPRLRVANIMSLLHSPSSYLPCHSLSLSLLSSIVIVLLTVRHHSGFPDLPLLAPFSLSLSRYPSIYLSLIHTLLTLFLIFSVGRFLSRSLSLSLPFPSPYLFPHTLHRLFFSLHHPLHSTYQNEHSCLEPAPSDQRRA